MHLNATLRSPRFSPEFVALDEPSAEVVRYEGVIGRSAALRNVLNQIGQVAPTDVTVLIYGETGTGKERFARAVHNLSGRRGQAFVKFNCAAIPATLLESDLFGTNGFYARSRGASAGSRPRTAARCSSTRLARSRSSCSRSCFAFCRNANSSVSAAPES